MKCSEFHEVAAAYALDALSEVERIACLHHLNHEGPHENCEALLERYERVIDQLAMTVSPAPVKPSLWTAIELRLGIRTRPEATATSTSTEASASPAAAGSITPIRKNEEQSRQRFREVMAWSAVGAALLGALWSHQRAQTVVRETEGQRERAELSLANTSTELATAQAARSECSAALAVLSSRGVLSRDAVSLLEEPGTRIAPMAAAGAFPYKATALYNAKTKRAVVLSSSVVPVEGKDYELWVIAAGQAPRPAGFLRFDASGVSFGEFDATLLGGQTPAALAVSLEPAGGRPTPTEVVLIAKLSG